MATRHREKMFKRTSRIAWIVAVSVCALALYVPSGAIAEPDWDFTPELTVSSSTYQAGAHPDLTIEMNRAFNHCVEPDPPYIIFINQCVRLYKQQNLKRLKTHLPPGLTSDANAAPYCDPYPTPRRYRDPLWRCRNEAARVGKVLITAQWCDVSDSTPVIEMSPNGCARLTFAPPPGIELPEGAAIVQYGVVYNDRPRTEGPYAGEQGHLVVLWPSMPHMPRAPGKYVRTDVSVTVRGSDAGIDAVADEIPDLMDNFLYGKIPGAFVQMKLTLDGSTGLEDGHPLLTNPTFCDPQTVDAEFQGYAHNSRRIWGWPNSPETAVIEPHRGDGKVVRDSAPYQATDCDKVPYDPKLELSLDNTGPDKAPALHSTVTQADGEATTDTVKVNFPSSYKINAQNKAEHCSDELLKATEDSDKDHCPEGSRIGKVTAESRLLPIGEKLEGNVYLAGLTGDSLKVSAFLRGFIDLRIDARGKVESDLSITTTFKDLPPAPISRFDLDLEGGDKGLLRTPRVCKKEEITADFESHSGKVKKNTIPMEITGCTDPVLDVELSNRRKGEKTNLDLSISSPGTAIKTVDLRLARHLKWGLRKRIKVKRKRRLKSMGLVSFTTAKGQVKNRLIARRTKFGNLGLTPLVRRTKEGEIGALQAPDLRGTLFRTKRKKPAFASKGKRKRARRIKRRPARFTIRDFPQADLTAVELSLFGKDGRRKFYLRNPTGCKRPLNFVAIITTTDGRRLALKDQVRLKGKGCGKKRKRR